MFIEQRAQSLQIENVRLQEHIQQNHTFDNPSPSWAAIWRNTAEFLELIWSQQNNYTEFM